MIERRLNVVEFIVVELYQYNILQYKYKCNCSRTISYELMLLK